MQLEFRLVCQSHKDKLSHRGGIFHIHLLHSCDLQEQRQKLRFTMDLHRLSLCFPSGSWISWFITTALSKDTHQSTQNTRLVMIIPTDSSFSSFCPYSSCLSLCFKKPGRLPVSLHIIFPSLQAMFRIRAEKDNKYVVFLRTLNLYSLRFERN